MKYRVYIHIHFITYVHTACSTTETELFLPPECKYVHNGELFDSFLLSSCNLEQCTTNSGPCRDADHGCCCRAIETELIDVECDEGSIMTGEGVSTNETRCACTICDDIEVLVSVLVREPGEDGAVISGAQVIDKGSGELLGLTFVNGKMAFTRRLGEKTVSVIVIAAGYLPREHMIDLIPTRGTIDVVVALLRRSPIPVTPEESGYTFRLGDYVYITIPADGFSKNGSVYNGVVLFDGVFMDKEDDGFLDMIDGNQFVLGENYFSLSFFTHSSFSDSEGDDLEVEGMEYYVEGPQSNTFLTTYNQESRQWLNLGAFKPLNTPIQKRQDNQNAVFFVQLNTPINMSFIFHAELANVSCWLQFRSFDGAGIPAQGPVGILEQTGTRPDGMGFTFRFGTNTGSVQSTSDGLAENAICLPLACDGFERGTVEGILMALVQTELTPIDFPEGTFNTSEIGAPTPLGRFFTFQEVVTSTDMLIRPFYDSVEDCITAGQIDNRDVDERSFFYFESTALIRVPNNAQCFVKVRVTECVRNPANTVVFTDTNGTRNTIALDHVDLIDETFSADHFLDNDCVPASRIVCIPFQCNTRFQVSVRDDTVLPFCNIDSLSPIVSVSPILLLQNLTPQSISLNTVELAEQDYNDLDLGLYFDPNPTAALEMCRDPLQTPGNVENTASTEGFAVSFNCIL